MSKLTLAQLSVWKSSRLKQSLLPIEGLLSRDSKMRKSMIRAALARQVLDLILQPQLWRARDPANLGESHQRRKRRKAIKIRELIGFISILVIWTKMLEKALAFQIEMTMSLWPNKSVSSNKSLSSKKNWSTFKKLSILAKSRLTI